ncbi:MAG: carbohydrate ABC transporter permease [Firmicutes bacterium]|nr:carbohydrate ABC transporter permease [Bacillota bacterium]
MQTKVPLSSRASVTFLFVLVAIYFVFPLYWLVISAFKTNAQLFQFIQPWFPPHLSLIKNLVELFSYDSGEYTRWLANSFLYAGASAIGATFFATLAGYSFAKYDYKWMRTIFWIILGSIFVPVTALVLPVFVLMESLHLINTYWGVILPSLVSPFGVYLTRIYADQGVPDALLEAARIDGASEWTVFWRVASRLLMPATATVFLITFVGTWNNFFLPLVILNSSTKFPAILGLNLWNSINAEGHAKLMYNMIITGAVVATIPLAISFILLQRYWRFGLTSGSVTG